LPEELCTVDDAAIHLKLHPKTILRFIREGRLKATRIGKSWRIHRSDLAALAGAPASPDPAAGPASVTAVVDIPGVSPDHARKLAMTITAVLHSKPVSEIPMRADVVHDEARAHLKIIAVGSLPDVSTLLSLVAALLDHQA
jgi:excisionase family DNA binding protein